MTINELTQKGLLEKVTVQKPPQDVIDAGNRKSKAKFQNPMGGYTCVGNSQSVVEAMADKGERDWHIVPGFAFNSEGKGPIIHVWIRKGTQHYDPTWIRWNWWSEDLSYYQVLQPLEIGTSERDILNRLKHLASKWKLELLEQLN